MSTPFLTTSARGSLAYPASVDRRHIVWSYAITVGLYHLLALAALVPWLFSWTGVVLMIAGVYVFGGLGINLCYHRLLTHRGFVCPKWLEYYFVVLGVCCMQDTPARWVAVHRRHHEHSDQREDPHSPLVNFLWGWAVAGSPADCVKLGVLQFCKETPRLIVSGINSGANVGINVLYSGTVAAAIEGAFFGITSIAVSQAYEEEAPDYPLAARRAVKLIEQLLSHYPRPGTLWNFNLPEQRPAWPRGLKVVRMGVTRHVETMEKRVRPRGRTYFWVGDEPVERLPMEPETDVRELEEGYATLTPLHIDMTHRPLLDRFAEFRWSVE